MSEEEFSDQQIRIELKRLVEREKQSLIDLFERDSREVARKISARDPGDDKVQKFNRKLQETRDTIETNIQAMLDFIDRD